MKEKILELDAMRAISITLILIHHLSDYSDIKIYDLNNYGIQINLSVINNIMRLMSIGVFIFISAYLLESNKITSIYNFIKSKFIRIFPLYYCSLLLFIILYYDFSRDIGLISLLIHMAGVQLIFASRYCEPIITLWFVGLITAYYGFYLLISMFEKKPGIYISLILIIPIIIILIKASFDFTDKKLLFYYPIFIMGILFKKYNIFNKINNKIILLLILIFMLSVTIYSVSIYPLIYFTINKPPLFSILGFNALVFSNIIILSFSILLFCFSNLIKKYKLFCLFEKIAYSSFCIYLFHRPIFSLLVFLYDPFDDLIRILYLIFFGLPLACISSYYIQKIYDLFFIPILKKRTI